MKIYFKFLCSALLLLTVTSAKSEIFFSSSSEMYTDAFRVYDLYKDNPKYLTDGEIIYWFARTEIGFSQKDFSVAYLQRIDSIVEHSSDAALIYYYENAKNPNIAEREYNYSISVNSLRSEGISLSYLHQKKNNFTSIIQIDLAKTNYLLDGSINGSLDYQSEILSADAEIDYFYYRDVIFERKINESIGTLAALNLYFEYKTDKTKHVLKIYDLFHKIHWETAPFTTMQIDSKRIGASDGSGNLKINPLGSGTEGFKDHAQQLDQRYYLSNAYHLKDSDLLFNINYVANSFWPETGLRVQGKSQSFTFLLSPKDEALIFEHKIRQNFNYSFSSDKLNLKKAHRINLSMSYQFKRENTPK